MKTLLVADKPIKIKKNRDIIIATTKPYVFEQMALQNGVVVESLESQEDTPSEEVWELLDRYVEATKAITDEYQWMYETDYAIEGQGLRQHIADVILCSRIVKNILKKYEIKNIELFIENDNLIECLTIYEMALNRGISVKIHYDSLTIYIKSMISPLAKKLFFVSVMVKKHLFFLNTWLKCENHSGGTRETIKYDVGILFSSNANKHYEKNKDILNSLQKRAVDYCLICVDCPKSYERAKKEKITAINTDSWIEKAEVVKIWKLWRKYAHQYKKLFSNFAYYLEGECFKENISREIAIDFMHRMPYVLKNCISIKSALEYYKFKYIRIFGGIEWQINRACYYFSRDYVTKLFEVVLPMAYDPHRRKPHINLLSLIWMSDETDYKDFLAVENYMGEIIQLPLGCFSKNNTVQDKADHNIDKNNIKILWAPSIVIKGWGTTHRELRQRNKGLIEGAIARNNIELFVKYHPNQDADEISCYNKSYSGLKVYDKDYSLQKLIDQADIIVTDVSTFVYDVVLQNKPLISICNQNNEKRIADVIPYIQKYKTAENFYDDLDRHCTTNVEFNDWISNILAKQSQYIDDRSRKQEDFYTDIIARELEQRIRNKNQYYVCDEGESMLNFLEWYFNYYIRSVYTMKIKDKKELKKYAGKEVLSVESANKWITDQIINSENHPFCVARFGAVELSLIRKFLSPVKHEKKIEANIEQFCRCAGFFPNDRILAKKYVDDTLPLLNNIDMLINWGNLPMEEYVIKKYLRKDVRIASGKILWPGITDNTWSKALEGKRVLVIHPFKDSILSQYEKREHLFADKRVLPEFQSLHVIKAVQTIAGEKDDRFNTWFDALEYMYNEAMKIDFDVAIIGCGAYGMSLALKLKKAGRSAIHMGGITQLLFGIKGGRWDDSGLYNEYWIRPNAQETPIRKDVVENSCYW